MRDLQEAAAINRSAAEGNECRYEPDHSSASGARAEALWALSHELRTPLNSVLGYAHLLQKTPLDQQQLDFLRRIVQAGQQIRDLVSEMVDAGPTDRPGDDAALR